MASTVCTFEARLAPGCVCAVALRRAADGSGGGVLFHSATSGLNSFSCSPETFSSLPPVEDPSAENASSGAKVHIDAVKPRVMRLEDLALCLECAPNSGCVSSRPVDLAHALDFGQPNHDGTPTSSRRHLGALVASRRPRRKPVARTTTTFTGAAPTVRRTCLATDDSTSSNATFGTNVWNSRSPFSRTDIKSIDTSSFISRASRVACASALKATVSVIAVLGFVALRGR